MPVYKQQWKVQGSAKEPYTVSVTFDDVWSCACMGWVGHMPRRDCKHIKGKKIEIGYGDQPVERRSARLGFTPDGTPMDSAPTAKSALKAGASPDEVADVARVKREEVQSKKAVKLGKIRHGFQLAHTYELSDLNSGEWVAEIKFDGELGMLIDGRLINRSGNDITHRFPEIEKVTDVVLVGEVVILDDSGQSYFNKIQERSTDDPIKIRALARQSPATFMAFDMLEDESGEDVTGFDLRYRRDFMESYFLTHSPKGMKLTEQIPIESDTDVQALVNKCRELETEGIMLKNMGAPYVAKRGRNWVKAKTWQERVFDIVRFRDTGIGDGFVIYVVNNGRECKVNCGSFQMREKIRKGHKRVEIKFLSEAEDGAMRFPSVRRLV